MSNSDIICSSCNIAGIHVTQANTLTVRARAATLTCARLSASCRIRWNWWGRLYSSTMCSKWVKNCAAAAHKALVGHVAWTCAGIQ